MVGNGASGTVSRGTSTYGPEPSDEVRMAYEMSYANVSVALARHVAGHDAHGYDQGERSGDGTMEKVHVGCRDFEMHGGDYDCTSLVGEVAHAQGLMDEDMAHELYTGNAESLLGDSGYSKMPYDESVVRPGDVLLRYNDPSRGGGHAAIASGHGMQIDASHGDGVGKVTGMQGDQDGTEVLERPLQDGWQVIMRPPDGSNFDAADHARSREHAIGSGIAFAQGKASSRSDADLGAGFAAGLADEEAKTLQFGQGISEDTDSFVRGFGLLSADGDTYRSECGLER